jgi:ribonuclease R
MSVNPRGFGFVSSLGASGRRRVRPEGVDEGGDARRQSRRAGARSRGSSRGRGGDRQDRRSRGEARGGRAAAARAERVARARRHARPRADRRCPTTIDASGPEGNSGKDGDAAIVKITRWPELPDENARGQARGGARHAGRAVGRGGEDPRDGNVDEVHSPRRSPRPRRTARRCRSEMLEGREDLTHLPLPTIDPEDARDHDDAVWVERTETTAATAPGSRSPT